MIRLEVNTAEVYYCPGCEKMSGTDSSSTPKQVLAAIRGVRHELTPVASGKNFNSKDSGSQGANGSKSFYGGILHS